MFSPVSVSIPLYCSKIHPITVFTGFIAELALHWTNASQWLDMWIVLDFGHSE